MKPIFTAIRVCHGHARHAERVLLRSRQPFQPFQPFQHRRAQLVQGRERELHL